jgi:hypothetical protein
MTVVHLKCKNGHEIALDVARPTGLLKLCKAGKRVCPSCKPENVQLSPFKPKENSFANDKKYACKHGHVTSFTPFTSGMINVTWGEEYENVPGVPQDVQEWAEQGTLKCRHATVDSAGRSRKCSCKLKPVDDSVLDYANSYGIKTKTRVGDIWEKNGCAEPVDSHHEQVRKEGQDDARYVETEFSRRNKRRLADIRKKRQSKKVGEVLKRPTEVRSDEKLTKNQATRNSRRDYD